MAETTNVPWECVWTNKEKDEFQLFKRDGTSLTIKKGTWISLPGRPDGDKVVIVNKIYSLDKRRPEAANACGPCGISYLPWRPNKNEFATPAFSMKGDERFIVCYPSGRNTYGAHIVWDNVTVCEMPDNVDPKKVDDLIYPMPKLVGSDSEEDDE